MICACAWPRELIWWWPMLSSIPTSNRASKPASSRSMQRVLGPIWASSWRVWQLEVDSFGCRAWVDHHRWGLEIDLKAESTTVCSDPWRSVNHRLPDLPVLIYRCTQRLGDLDGGDTETMTASAEISQQLLNIPRMDLISSCWDGN